MGTKAAVILAILTVGYLVIKLYTILPSYFPTEYTRKRFKDDCFITRKKNENLDLFEEILNNLHSSIKFTNNTLMITEFFSLIYWLSKQPKET